MLTATASDEQKGCFWADVKQLHHKGTVKGPRGHDWPVKASIRSVLEGSPESQQVKNANVSKAIFFCHFILPFYLPFYSVSSPKLLQPQCDIQDPRPNEKFIGGFSGKKKRERVREI